MDRDQRIDVLPAEQIRDEVFEEYDSDPLPHLGEHSIEYRFHVLTSGAVRFRHQEHQ